MLPRMTHEATEDEARAIVRWMREVTPRVLLPNWTMEEDHPNAQLWRRSDGLLVITEVAFYEGAPWLHVSCSYRNRTPHHAELVDVKTTFIGDRLAVQVFPIRAEYVNEHPHCLHLWCRLDGERITPDFRRTSADTGRSGI